jgi:hypothetical protein
MADIRSPWLLYLKGGLFLVIGGVASALLLIDHPGVKEAFLLAMAVWGFSRAYYFAFYVVERYVDREYKFAGLWSFARYLARRGGTRVGETRDGGTDGP